MAKYLKPSIVIVLFLFLINLAFSYNWPFKEGGVQTVEQKIRQTVGAARGTDPPSRFHRGIDICPNDTLNKAVYAINADTAYLKGTGDNRYVLIGDFYYIHVDADSSIDSTYVNIGDSLGEIFYVYGTTHLHFQHGGSSPDIYNPLGGGIVDSLTPYTDTIRPFIDPDSVNFCDQTSGEHMNADSLYGRIDIDAKLYDWTNRGVNGPEDHLGRIYPYKIGFQILDTLGKVVYDTILRPSETGHDGFVEV